MSTNEPEREAIVVELTDELKAKIIQISDWFIDTCKREGLTPIESYYALTFLTKSLENMMGMDVNSIAFVDKIGPN